MAVLLVGTLDTKGVEVAFVRDLLRAGGVECLVLDAGIQGVPPYGADIAREEVFVAAGTTLGAVRSAGDRGRAVTAAARGTAAVCRRLHAEGRVGGVLGLGGSAGTTIATAAMRDLPLGVPKLMVSTMASGQVRPYVGVRDILLMHSVVDLSGLNRVSRVVLSNAAFAMIGMVRGPSALVPLSPEYGGEGSGVRGTSVARSTPLTPDPSPPEYGGRGEPKDRPIIAATMFGVTTPCVEAARAACERAGFEVLVFHAAGSGGQTMETLIADGVVAGVLDATTTELADELVGGTLSAGPDRLTAAAVRGIPQAIGLGALDMVNFGPPDTVPERFRQRRFHQHNATVTLMRTTPAENDRLGKEIALKASAAKGPTTVYVPLRGVSALDKEGQPFWWPEADQALFQSLRDWMSPHVRLVELDLHINDPAFAEAMAGGLVEALKGV